NGPDPGSTSGRRRRDQGWPWLHGSPTPAPPRFQRSASPTAHAHSRVHDPHAPRRVRTHAPYAIAGRARRPVETLLSPREREPAPGQSLTNGSAPLRPAAAVVQHRPRLSLTHLVPRAVGLHPAACRPGDVLDGVLEPPVAPGNDHR